MNTKHTHISSFLSLFILMVTISACQKESELDIPSYITIKSIAVYTAGDQGTASNKIADAWVYTGNDLEGAFELPASFPVLKSGSTVVHIYPGIKMNGIAETRVPYPFYDTISRVVNLTRETEANLGNLTTRYKKDVVFGWLEDFEDPYLTLDTTARNTIKLVRTSDPLLADAFPGEGNYYAARVQISNDSSYFEYISHDSFTFSQTLPEEKSYVFLELNYKNNTAFTVGLMIYGTTNKMQDVLVVNPSDNWNKIYINFTPTIANNSDATKFRVYINARKNYGSSDADIFFDNIKLLHF